MGNLIEWPEYKEVKPEIQLLELQGYNKTINKWEVLSAPQ